MPLSWAACRSAPGARLDRFGSDNPNPGGCDGNAVPSPPVGGLSSEDARRLRCAVPGSAGKSSDEMLNSFDSWNKQKVAIR
jgi:hypothetical protein